MNVDSFTGKNSNLMKKIIPFLKQLTPVLIRLSIVGVISISVTLYFTSCTSMLKAEKFDYRGSIGKNHTLIVSPDTLHSNY